MSFKYAHLMHMTANELHNHLMQRNIPPETREQIKTIVLEQKAIEKSNKNQRMAVTAQWRPIISALYAERESLRSMLNYKNEDETDPRMIALQGYKLVLDRLHLELDGYKRMRLTPAKLAKENNIPNGGIHWVDWVKPKFIQRVMDLFAEIPYKPRARQKEPFRRYVKMEDHAEQVARLRKRTEKELGVAKLDAQITSTDGQLKKIATLEEALRRIDRMLPTDPVPRTYSGMFPEWAE